MNGQLATRHGRSLFPWSHRGSFPSLRDEMEQLFERFWDENGDDLAVSLMSPPADVSETEKDVTVKFDLPGVQAKEIDVQLQGNQLFISGERKDEKEDKGETWHRVERRTGRFSRSMTLPCRVQEEKIDATMKDGILTVVLPKTAEAHGRRIEVKS